MGFLRLFLALSVLNSHFSFSQYPPWLASWSAVAAFFVISGFYISLALDGDYAGSGGIWRFYANRLLRLMPVYWVTLALIILLTEFGHLQSSMLFDPVGSLIVNGKGLEWNVYLSGLATNVFLFPASTYAMVAGFNMESPWMKVVSGQMYTVGLEMMFYLLAPALTRVSTKAFLAILCVGLSLHFAPHWAGLPVRPWQYEYFPSVLAFFLLGRLAYLLYTSDAFQSLASKLSPSVGWTAPLVILLLSTVFHEDMAAFTNTWQTWVFYLSFTVLLPIVFHASKQVSFDRFIGNISYPLYVCHFLVISGLMGLNRTDKWTVLGAVVGCSILLYWAVDLPVERWRRRIRESSIRRALDDPVS